MGRDKTFLIRFTEEEFALLEEYAEKDAATHTKKTKEKNISAYIRKCIFSSARQPWELKKELKELSYQVRKIGVNIEEFDDSIRVWVDGPLVRTNVKTMPHPGFPTDMQPQITTLLTLAEGTSIITEGVWEQRFRYVDELRRMGADISVDGKVAVVEGTGKLTGAPVKACDLRAGAALIIAGLAAHGVTEIEDIYHIERGYSNLDAKLREIGADIVKVSEPSVQEKQLKEAL